jgi:predicted transposase/invertase (TIGR01784 family)
VVFRRLFDDSHLLCSLLNALLDPPPAEQLTELLILSTHVAGPLADDKEVVLDLRAETRSGRTFHIEVQVRSFVAYPERMLYYWAGIYHGQLEVGDAYGTLQPVISVHLLGFTLLPHDEKYRHYHHVFELLERRTGYRLTDQLQLHTVEMRKFGLDLSTLATPEEKWLYYLRHGDQMTPTEVHELAMSDIEKAEEQLKVISQDRILRAQYEARMKAARDALSWQKDHIAKWQAEGRAEGERLGLDKGRAEGRAEGERLGLDKGRAEGERVRLRESILDLCDAFSIPVSAERRAWLDTLDLTQLDQLRHHLKQSRSWPAH